MSTTTTGETGHVDLSVCQKGDVMHCRNGSTEVFDNGEGSARWPYRSKDGEEYRQDGSWSSFHGEPNPADIIRVERNGQVVTPVAGETAPDVWPDMLTFLDQAGRGCISGRVADWPQLKPACAWAAAEIQRYMAQQPPATVTPNAGPNIFSTSRAICCNRRNLCNN
jgi:hypothetical protein